MLVKQPQEYTIDEVSAQILVTSEQITALRAIAPELRRQHLHKRHKEAKRDGLNKKATEIAQIISREELKTRYKEVNRTTKRKKGGGKVFRVEREEEDGSIASFSTKAAVEAVVGQSIGERYRLAYSAPIMSNAKLLQDVGFTGDGPAVQEILEGTYNFPPETDEYTKLLCTEAAVLFCSLGGDGVADWVRDSDFQHFWLHA